MRSWEVPPDDGSKCQKCKRTHRLGFYRGITYRDRCECNKGGRKIADEWKLLGYECYKRGLREKGVDLVNRLPWSSGRSPNLPDLGRRRGRCRTSTWGLVRATSRAVLARRPKPSRGRRRRVDRRITVASMAWRRRQRRRRRAGRAGLAAEGGDQNRGAAKAVAIELPPPRKLAPRVPTPDPSKPFAAGGFQAFKRKWQQQQQQQTPAVTVSTGPSRHQKRRRRPGRRLMVNLHQNCPKVEERRSRATILGRSRYSRATGAARCVGDRTFGEGTRALPADVAGGGRRATRARMPTKGH